MYKKTAIGVVLILFALAIGGFGVLSYLNDRELKRVRNMPIGNVDLGTIKDGHYIGSYSYARYVIRVDVTVKHHKIVNIVINQNSKSRYAVDAEGLVKRVLEKQTPNVDVVSGASTSSKALLKAIENALTQGQEKR